MRAARYYGREDVRIEEVEPPALGPDDVRIEVAACGICGSDLRMYTDGPKRPLDEPHPVTDAAAPFTLGHEVGGTVVAVGSNVTALDVGTTVAVNPIVWCGSCRYCDAGHYNRCASGGFVGLSAGGGGFATELVVSAEKAVPVPESVPAELAATVEPFSVALHAVARSAFSPGDDAAVFGAGPIGLAVVQQLRASGAGRIAVSEPHDARRDLAAACGADVLLDPVTADPVERLHEETDRGVDVAYEVAGVEPTFTQAVEATRTGGDVTVVSLFDDAVAFQPTAVVAGERTVTGTAAFHGGPRSAEEFSVTARRIAAGDLDPERLLTDRLPLDDLTDGIRRLLADDADAVKILVRP